MCDETRYLAVFFIANYIKFIVIFCQFFASKFYRQDCILQPVNVPDQ